MKNMTRQEQIKWLKEYRWHVLSLIREQENMKDGNANTEKKEKQKQKTLVLTKNFYGRQLKVGYGNN